jgi:phospholipid/cholesterol/gamma-HCH transport system permease protein
MTSASSTISAGVPATITLEGRITAYTVAPIWRAALETLSHNPDRPVRVDAARLEYVDNTGLALLFDLQRSERSRGAEVRIENLAPNLAALVEGYDPADFAHSYRRPAAMGMLEHAGRATAHMLADLKDMVAFLGECTAVLGHALRHRGTIRWREVVAVATEAGANAVPIVTLIGFLMGVIIAFQTALVAQDFGAVLFVVNGVGIAMLRELGPLMTAIVFAGRTGAAFAAQIGTQKVNEEVNAIVTFGLDPVRFLVLPRLLAAAVVMPLLTVLADVIGIFGGAVVMLSFDIGLVQYYRQLVGAVDASDFVLGLIKAMVFGVVIAAIGCRRGLSTGAGAAAVGRSATSTVVTSIVWIVALDGVFAVLVSRLHL